MAMSLNGMIARDNGAEDFLSHANWEKFCELANSCGNFIVGRKTYEAVMGWQENFGFDDLVGVEKVVLSQSLEIKLKEGYTLVPSPHEALKYLSHKGHTKILLTGGASVNSAFMKEKLVDEIILNIEPVIIGTGISLFAPDHFDVSLQCVSAETSAGGIVTLTYIIHHSSL